MQRVWQHPWQRAKSTLGRMTNDAHPPTKLVFSIAEAAEALGVSDDLIYELTARGELPCVRLGRRKLIPAIAIQAVIDASLDEFELEVRRGSWRGCRGLPPLGSDAGPRSPERRTRVLGRGGARPQESPQ